MHGGRRVLSVPVQPKEGDVVSIAIVDDPIDFFAEWYKEAEDHPGIDDHTAVALATADAEGRPDVRMVLLKGFDQHGFVFYTNLESVKGQQLAATPHAALCFYWMPMERQVRVRGPVAPVPDEEADAYYHSRPRQSQIGAWASKQSQVLEGRFELERRVAQVAAKHPFGEIPRPPFWSGFRIAPERIEFWKGHRFRLHDRIEYRRDGGQWSARYLFP